MKNSSFEERSRLMQIKNYGGGTSGWSTYARGIAESVALYTIAGILGDIVDFVSDLGSKGFLADAMMDSSRGESLFDTGDIIGFVFPLLVLAGYIGFFNNLKKFSEQQQSPTDTASVLKVRTGALLLLIASIIAIIPLVGKFIAAILYLIGYIKMSSGYKALKNSPQMSAACSRAFGTLRACIIWTLVGVFIGVLPIVGSIIKGLINFIVFFSLVGAWRKVAKNAPVLDENGVCVNGAQRVSNFQNHPNGNTAPAKNNGCSEYDRERLQEIIDNAAMYNPELVAQCKAEIDVRDNAETIMPQVKEYDDEKINAILSADAGIYSASLLYCCKKVKAERDAIKARLAEEERLRQEEEQRKEAEEERIRLEKEAEERRLKLEKEKQERKERNKALWKKYQILVYALIGLLVVLMVVLYLNSNGRRYDKGTRAFENGNTEEAIKWLGKVDKKYKNYPSAGYMLYCSHVEQGDSTAAAKSLKSAVAGLCWSACPKAYETYSTHLVKGTFAPYIQKEEAKAAMVMATSDDRATRLAAAQLYFKVGNYAKAHPIFSDEADRNHIAKGYMGFYHLFGLDGVEKDIKLAREALKDVPYVAPFLDYIVILDIAFLSEDKRYEAIGKIKGLLDFEDDFMGVIDPKELKPILSELLENRNKYEKKNDWGYYAGDWNYYRYNKNNNEGSYLGMTGSWGNDSGAHKGWGCFVGRTGTTVNNIYFEVDYYYVNFGKYHQCNLQGPGVETLLNLGENYISLDYGKYENDSLKTGVSWSNSSIDRQFRNLEIELPF